ncbi:alpha/beta hydrolase [Dactylosporangium cerinum]
MGYRVVGDGPLGVVLVHGWSCTGNAWNTVVDELPTAGRRYVLPDLRGHGSSAGEGLEHSVKRYAEDVLAAANAAGLDRFVTIGHSMGAKYAQYIRVLAGDRVLGYVGVAPTPSSTVDEEADEDTIAWMSGGAGSPEAFVGIQNYITKEPLPEHVLRPAVQEASTLTSEVLAGSMRAFATADFTDELAHAPQVPALIIGGTADPFYPPNVLELRIAIENPGARLAVLDYGHDLPRECPAEVAALIDQFLIDLTQ